MGNTVGSRENLHWNTNELRKIRETLHFSGKQKALLIGTILGDGCLTENFGKKNYRLQIEQGKDRKEYVFWFHDAFKNWMLSQPKYLESRRSWRFKTISHPEITEFHKIFYRSRKKIVPANIEKFLIHPISLAIWFMDDGTARKNARTYNFSVHCFSRKDNEILVKCLRNNFGLDTKLHWDGKGYRLYIPAREAIKFEELVMPYILPSFKYKFPLTP